MSQMLMMTPASDVEFLLDYLAILGAADISRNAEPGVR